MAGGKRWRDGRGWWRKPRQNEGTEQKRQRESKKNIRKKVKGVKERREEKVRKRRGLRLLTEAERKMDGEAEGSCRWTV